MPLIDLMRVPLKKVLRALPKLLKIKKSGATTPIIVSGFTDPLGKFSYNQKLSSQRANTVAKLLVQQGIEANRIQIQANSQTDLYKQCSGNNSSQLIQCLAPNRRVNINW